MPIVSQHTFANETVDSVLDDLSVRFIINCPPEELASVERVCFQVEEAHWFYEDFIREQNPQLPSLSLRAFSARIFAHCPLLRKWSNVHEQAFDDFITYKTRVPVRGAIMLNDKLDHCVLVKGWKQSSGWSFPKGKINKNEPDDECAAREVMEETGYDVTRLLKKKDYIELTLREQHVRLYIIQGVPMDTNFVPQTRKEISKVDWFALNSLPTYSKNKLQQKQPTTNANGVSAKRFYMIAPFLNLLRRWLNSKHP
ncbi:DCP2-domain-containing protein, partial [Dipodascopsis tothii]|uniref:DCP2-domain-containing protein n=1 Tax=Dipodascopsis tothii TaxID=44089 RepID=UPI0034CF2967